MAPSDWRAVSTVNANDVVAFLVELVVLGLLAWAGFQSGGVAGWVLGIGLPVVAAVAWGLFAAPRARVSSFGLRLVTKLVVLGPAWSRGSWCCRSCWPCSSPWWSW